MLLPPIPCLVPDSPRFWFNTGGFPDALRCQDLEGGTRFLKTLALDTYSYSPERKDSLSKPHPFTATQFPFFVSWLKTNVFFFLLLSSMVSGSLRLSLFHPPTVPAPHLLGTFDITILRPALKELFSTLLGSLRLWMGLGWTDRLSPCPPQSKGAIYFKGYRNGQHSERRLTGKKQGHAGTERLPKRNVFRVSCFLKQRRFRVTQLNSRTKDTEYSWRDPKVQSPTDIETWLPLLSHFLRKYCFYR